MDVHLTPASPARSEPPALSLVKIRQQFDRPLVRNIQQAVADTLLQSGLNFLSGTEIALAVGSRGIANLSRIIRTVVEFLHQRGAKPFIVPAMGSHGGATADGQQELLASFGITESAMNCPIRSSMEVISLPARALPHPLFMDRHAFNSDGIIVINRIKPHTDFHGSYESGLVKMCVIGLGKERQAFEMHRFGTHGLRDLVPKAAEHLLAIGKILLGLAIIENAYDETAHIEAIPGDQILAREPALLEMSRKNMPSLPVTELDVLIVDRLGKNISGTGLDTNIIGRIRISSEPEPLRPRIKSIVVTDLTPESHGNATGIGLADVTTRRLLSKIDFGITYTNLVTSGFLERAKLPLVAQNDATAVQIALRAAGVMQPGCERVIRIQDTLHLSEIYVSPTILEEISSQVEVVGSAAPAFTANGELHDFDDR